FAEEENEFSVYDLWAYYQFGEKPSLENMQGEWTGKCVDPRNEEIVFHEEIMQVFAADEDVKKGISNFDHGLPFVSNVAGKPLAIDSVNHTWQVRASFNGCGESFTLEEGRALISPLYGTSDSWQYTHWCSINRIINDYSEIHRYNFRVFPEESTVYVIRLRRSSQGRGNILRNNNGEAAGSAGYRNVFWEYENIVTEMCYFAIK
ncbi:MAG: hypothetical protein OXB84_06205, partial [Halobacteriovoraceae bacterium]|nr:hypothetical protein [Halobacteriovoraceae bacterium]